MSSGVHWKDRGLYQYGLATVLLLCSYVMLSRGLSHIAHSSTSYATWGLEHQAYSDVIKLSLDHYVRHRGFIHPVPYVHDKIEYPILLGFTLWAPSFLPGGVAAWFAASGVLVAAATMGSIAIVRTRAPRSAWWLAASPALALDGGINWDLIGILFLVMGMIWFGQGHHAPSGVATAAGTWFKLFPVVVAPMALAALASQWWHGGRTKGHLVAVVRWLVPFVVVSLVIEGPFLLANSKNTLWFFRFNSMRFQKDSPWALINLAVGGHGLSLSVINTITLLVVAVVCAWAAWAIWRLPESAHPEAVALGAAVAVITWMAVNKIWNPQYVLWVVAVAACVSLPFRYGALLAVYSCVDWWFEFVLRTPTSTNFWSWFGQVDTVARTVLFAAMAWWCVRRMQALHRGEEPAQSAGQDVGALIP